MNKLLVAARRKGFTLVEVLVTTIVVGVLAAVVVPAISNQTTAADPTRVSNDLGAVKNAIDAFNAASRVAFPGYVDDLTSNVSSSALILGSTTTTYGNAGTERWNGPYLTVTIPSTVSDNTDGSVISTGFAGYIQNKLTLCRIATGVNCSGTYTDGDYVSIAVNGLTTVDFDKVNTVVDGADDAGSQTGRLRYNASGTTYFLATPFSS